MLGRSPKPPLNPAHPGLPLQARLGLLPLPERAFVAWLLLAALLPAVLPVLAEVSGAEASPVGAVLRSAVALTLLETVVTVPLLLLLERPRSPSPRAYLGQLRARLCAVQSHYDGALRRLHQQEAKP